MHIAAVEDAIIAACNTALDGRARQAESLPGGWSLDMLKSALQFAPSVFVAYQGSDIGSDFYRHNGRFTVYVVSKGADELRRRRGNTRIMGAYDMLDRLVPALAVLTIPNIGKLSLASIDNLFRDAMFDLGGTVYGIQCKVRSMSFAAPDEDTLNDFVTWHAEHEVGDADTPNAIDEFIVQESP